MGRPTSLPSRGESRPAVPSETFSQLTLCLPDAQKTASSDKLDGQSVAQHLTSPLQPPTAIDDSEMLIRPFHSFILSFSMIVVSEIGDKTFLVAALMAMKHDRVTVFSAAFGALAVMTVLSAVLGHAVPALVPKRITSLAASVLFFVFGAKLLKEGLAMDPNEGVTDEMHEVENEIAAKEREGGRGGGREKWQVSAASAEMGVGGPGDGEGNHNTDNGGDDDDDDNNDEHRQARSRSRFGTLPRSPSSSPSPGSSASVATNLLRGLHNLSSLVLSPAWVQTFVMTFLAEWGDRSQIATIAMAAGQDYWWVTLGAIFGHACCTGLAVIGGRALAGKVSMRVGKLGSSPFFLPAIC